MTATVREEKEGKILAIRLTGKLVKEDYEKFVMETDRLVKKHGKIRMLVEMHDFHGWTAGAAWEDLKLAVRHFSDIDRIALVGETRWQKGMAVFSKPFTRAEVRFFELGEVVEAHTWLEED